MKKILFILILLIPFIVYAEYDESKVTVESIDLAYIEGFARNNGVSVDGNGINLSCYVGDVGDRLVYNLVVKNESGEDVELYHRLDKGDNINYVLMAPDLDYVVKNNSSKTFQLSVEYVNQVNVSNLVNGPISSNHNYVFEISNELGQDDSNFLGILDGGNTNNAVVPATVDNPNTKAVKNILAIVCIIFIISIGLFLILRRKNRIGKLFVIVGLIGIITPIIVYAYKSVGIKVKTNVNIKEPIVTYSNNSNRDTIKNNEIVKIGNEEFYVIGREDDDLILFAKYNLAVGKYRVSSGANGNVSERTDENYYRQSSLAVGVTGENVYHGVVSAASSTYWKSTTDSSLYVDPTYPNIYNYKNNAFQYFKIYENYLKDLGVNVKEIRLLDYKEAIKLGCSETEGNCNNAPEYLTKTSFWLGNAGSGTEIWTISNEGVFEKSLYSTAYVYGVRPVIKIGKSVVSYEDNDTYPLCRKAKELHKGLCLRTDTYACIGNGSEVTFGTLVNGNPKVGDAYDCDVNNDGVYDAHNERFYYIKSEGNNSVLIYSKNTGSKSYYADDSDNWHGPQLAYQYLPTNKEWSNPGLIPPGTRNIVNELGGNTTNNGANTIESFTYTNRAARLLTYQEVNDICDISDLSSCLFLLDNLDYYLYKSNYITDTYWLETPYSAHAKKDYLISGGMKKVDTSFCYYASGEYCDFETMVRPVITIKTSDLEK
ncbi:MAG: hypothetical protein IKQ29_00465 [Bacilli bacterium]|nr:hypothetical protein [Bacilli bacterium]